MGSHFVQVVDLAIHLQGAIERHRMKYCHLLLGIVLALASSMRRVYSLLVGHLGGVLPDGLSRRSARLLLCRWGWLRACCLPLIDEVLEVFPLRPSLPPVYGTKYLIFPGPPHLRLLRDFAA